MKKGTIIVIEGTDGTGKETQTKLLCQSLTSEGLSPRELHFPCYGTKACGPTEMYLSGDFGRNSGDVSPYAASTMFAIDRFASFKMQWGEFYNQGGLLLSNRYTTSNAIHQGEAFSGAARTDFLNWLYDFEYNKIGIPKPDLVFYLDLNPDISARMLKERQGKDGVQNDIFESDFDRLRRCNKNAFDVAKISGWVIIQAGDGDKMRPREDIHADILGVVHQFLAER